MSWPSISPFFTGFWFWPVTSRTFRNQQVLVEGCDVSLGRTTTGAGDDDSFLMSRDDVSSPEPQRVGGAVDPGPGDVPPPGPVPPPPAAPIMEVTTSTQTLAASPASLAYCKKSSTRGVGFLI